VIVIILPDLSTEDRLLAQALRGDQAAIMQIYEAYFTPIYQYIRLRVDDAMTAEDLTSDVFVKLIRALRGAGAPRTSLRGWLFRVARSELADAYGKNTRIKTTVLDEWIHDATEEQPEFRFMGAYQEQRAQNAIRMLAADQQEVLILRFGQQLSLNETADIMGKSVSAIKSLQWRATETLRQILSGDGNEEAAYYGHAR
jgi:RNA polymerase sigma-70 factor (ECF subfamily)